MKVVYGRRRVEFAALEADPDFRRLKEPVLAIGTGLPEKGVAFTGTNNASYLNFADLAAKAGRRSVFRL